MSTLTPVAGRARTYARFVKIEHALFSLPLILAGALLASPGGFPWATLGWIALAGTGARTAALALNRLLDRAIDARNPRTKVRELPSGAMSVAEGWTVALAGAAAYAFAAARLNPLCLALSPVPLAVFALYPLLKRVTPLCHFGVGVALALSPLGGYLAVRPDLTAAFSALTWWALARWPSPWVVGALALVGAGLAWQQHSAENVDLAFFRINAGLGFAVLAVVLAGQGLPR